MSSEFLLILRTLPGLFWSLFTTFKLPGLNFSPAVLFFGILSFGLAMKLLKGVLQVSSDGIAQSAAKRLGGSKDE